MEYLRKYNDYVPDGELLMEELSFNKNKELLNRIGKEFNINFDFLLPFGVGITAFLPLVNHIVNNQNYNVPITNETIFLLSVVTLCIAFKQIDFKTAKIYFKEHNLTEIFKDVYKSITSFKKIYDYVFEVLKKSVENIMDTFTYTTLLVPFCNILLSLVNGKSVTMDELIGCGMSLGAGVITIVTKHLLKTIYSKLETYVKNFFNLFKKKKETLKEGVLEGFQFLQFDMRYRKELYELKIN
jgi:hypothetical protein